MKILGYSIISKAYASFQTHLGRFLCVYQRAWHFLVGCQTGPLIWDGNVIVTEKANNGGIWLGHHKVYQCNECQEPFIHFKEKA